MTSLLKYSIAALVQRCLQPSRVYDLNHRKYRIRSDIRLHKDTYGVIQMTRPFSSTNGGTYFGIKQVF